MFYISSARLYRMADAIDDHDPPVIIDYISAASGATFCDIRWISNEPSSVEILYGRQIDHFEHSVSSDRFTEDQVITLSKLAPSTRYYYQLDLTDAAGNRSSNGPYDFTTDEFPFQISNVRFNGLADSAATILWETDIASAGKLHYGTTPALAHSVQDSGFATDHYIRLEGLLADTVYYFKIEAYDETGNIAYADHHGAYYRFRTSALNQTPLAVEIDGDGIDNDGDGFSDRNDPDGYLAVDSNIGTSDSVSDLIGSLEDNVDFGFRHWSVAAADPIDDDRDIDDSMGAHNATNNGGRILEISIFGGTTEWDFNVSQPGFYILSLFGWWRDTQAYYFDSNQWKQLPQPSGHSAQYYLIRLSQPLARFKLENGFVASPYLLAVASTYNDSLIMWHWNNTVGQHRNRAVHQSLNMGGTTHLVPLVLLWYDDTVALTSPSGRLPPGAVWPDFGRAVSLTGFESSDNIHFALQCGVGGFHGNHQDQGSFFLNAYGERLVGEGGVYNFEDSKYHNIIMIDDMGQGTPDLEQPKRAGIAGLLHTSCRQVRWTPLFDSSGSLKHSRKEQSYA